MPEPIWTPGPKTEWEQNVIDVQPSATKGFVTPDGRKFQDSELTISPEWAAQMHHGYRCARCLERFRDPIPAWPERCPVCKFEVAKYQRQALEEQYRGVDTTVVAPGFPLERERAHLEKELYRPKGLVTMSVPKAKRRG